MRVNGALPYYGAAAALVLILIVEWLPASQPAALPPARVPHLAPADQTADSKDTSDWADAILQRPLFTVGRKPAKSDHGPHTTAGSGLPRLAGVIIMPAGRRAIFMPDGGKPVTVAEGASLDDCTVRQIRPDRVGLACPKGETVLLLTFDKTHPGGLVTTAAPAFPQPGMTPGFPNPGFNPGFNPAVPGFQGQPPQPVQPQNDNSDDSSDSTPAPAPPPQAPIFPGPRGPNIPRGRE
jgi:hypothetical protein